MNTLSNKRKGFTLIELVVVIAIIGILLAIAVPKLSQYRAAASQRAIDANARQLFTAAQSYADSDAVAAAAAAAVPPVDPMIFATFSQANLQPYMTTTSVTIQSVANAGVAGEEAALITAAAAAGDYAVGYGTASAGAANGTNVMIVVVNDPNAPAATHHRIYYDGVFNRLA